MVGPRTRLAGVMGWPVEHSRSPALHNAAYAAAGIDAVYVALPVREGSLAESVAAIRALGFLGVNLTAPHKQAVMALCDTVDARAARAGAVNTVVVARDGRLEGHNTDVDGFLAALDERTSSPIRRAVVLGAGGAARAVIVALAERGVVIDVVARRPERAADLPALGVAKVLPWTAEALGEAFSAASLVVDATSAALDQGYLPAPLPVDRLADAALVCTLVYHRAPPWLAAARARGLATMDGASMLVHQAAQAFELMTGRPAPLAAMRATVG